MEDRWRCRELVEEAVEAGARRGQACRLLGVSLRTYQRWQKEPEREDGRCGPKRKPDHSLSEEEKTVVLEVADSEVFRDLSPTQIVPILADAGIYIASESSFYRILREAKQLAHRSAARPRSHRRPQEYVATGPNQVWCWDITYLRSAVRGAFYYLYLVVDIFSRKIVGWAVHEVESSELASELILQACRREGVDPESLVIHSDNGGPMKGVTLLAMLQFLGIVPSFSRPRVSEDNAFAEAVFRTLKYRPQYPSRPFESLEAAWAWVSEFVRWYNYEHLHSAIRFVTPASRHAGEDVAILAERKRVYEEARELNPRRWSRATRNWTPVGAVTLNRASDGRTEIISTNKADLVAAKTAGGREVVPGKKFKKTRQLS